MRACSDGDGRAQHARKLGSQDDLIADAVVVGDKLVVLTCAAERIEAAVGVVSGDPISRLELRALLRADVDGELLAEGSVLEREHCSGDQDRTGEIEQS